MVSDDAIITALVVYAALLTFCCVWLFDKWTDANYHWAMTERKRNELADKFNSLLADAKEVAVACEQNYEAAQRYRILYEDAVRDRYDDGDEWKRLQWNKTTAASTINTTASRFHRTTTYTTSTATE